MAAKQTINCSLSNRKKPLSPLTDGNCSILECAWFSCDWLIHDTRLEVDPNKHSRSRLRQGLSWEHSRQWRHSDFKYKQSVSSVGNFVDTHTHALTDCLPLLRIDLMTMLEKVTFCPKSSVKVTNKPQPSILNLTSLAVVGGYWLLFAQQTDRPSVYVVCDTLFVNVTQVTTETASSRVHVFSTFLPGGRHLGGLVGSATHTHFTKWHLFGK